MCSRNIVHVKCCGEGTVAGFESCSCWISKTRLMVVPPVFGTCRNITFLLSQYGIGEVYNENQLLAASGSRIFVRVNMRPCQIPGSGLLARDKFQLKVGGTQTGLAGPVKTNCLDRRNLSPANCIN